MDKQKQAGFSTITIVILLLIIAIIGAVGWSVWGKKSKPSTYSTNNNQQTNQSSITNNQTPNKNYGYLTLSEYSVRIPLNEVIKDLKLGKVTSSHYSQNDKFVAIIAPELDNSWVCSPDPSDGYKGFIGSISITAQTKRSGPDEPLSTKKLGNNTYGYEQGAANCTMDIRYQQLVDEFKNQFQKMESY